MKLKIQTILQLAFWILGMAIDYSLEGHVLTGGLIGCFVGLIAVLIVNFSPFTQLT